MATVLKTIALYGKSDVLGRPVHWNFDEPKLTVIPRMGQEENAYYKRDLKRLEFYYFRGRVDSSQIVYTVKLQTELEMTSPCATEWGIRKDPHGKDPPDKLGFPPKPNPAAADLPVNSQSGSIAGQ